MSITYADITKSSYPDELDPVRRYEDPSASDLTLINSYQAKILAGDLTGANQILIDNPSLESKILNAEKLNILGDELIALERYFKDTVIDDINTYFINCLTYRGVYNNTATYTKYDVVAASTGNLLQNFICIKDAPVGTPVTNTTYWRNFTLTGNSGTGLSFIGAWSEAVSYIIDDCVSYDNCLWACLEANSNTNPKNSSKWIKVVDFTTIVEMVASGINVINIPDTSFQNSKYKSGLYHCSALQMFCSDINYSSQQFSNHIIKKIFIDDKNCILYLSSIGTDNTYMRYMLDGIWYPNNITSSGTGAWYQTGYDKESYTFTTMTGVSGVLTEIIEQSKIGSHVNLKMSVNYKTTGFSTADNNYITVPLTADIKPSFAVIIPVYFSQGYTGNLIIDTSGNIKVYGLPNNTVLGTLYVNAEFNL